MGISFSIIPILIDIVFATFGFGAYWNALMVKVFKINEINFKEAFSIVLILSSLCCTCLLIKKHNTKYMCMVLKLDCQPKSNWKERKMKMNRILRACCLLIMIICFTVLIPSVFAGECDGDTKYGQNNSQINQIKGNMATVLGDYTIPENWYGEDIQYVKKGGLVPTNGGKFISVTGGTPPYLWSIEGTNFELGSLVTNDGANFVRGYNESGSACGLAKIMVVDSLRNRTVGVERSANGYYSYFTACNTHHGPSSAANWQFGRWYSADYKYLADVKYHCSTEWPSDHYCCGLFGGFVEACDLCANQGKGIAMSISFSEFHEDCD